MNPAVTLAVTIYYEIDHRRYVDRPTHCQTVYVKEMSPDHGLSCAWVPDFLRSRFSNFLMPGAGALAP